MSTPTIATAGTTGGFLLITDHEGTGNRVPKASVCNIMNSSNGGVYRIEVCHSNGKVILLFSDAAEVAIALAAFDDKY